MEAKGIGTVEVLRLRTYPLDPLTFGHSGLEAVVSPGTFPLYELDGRTKFWLLEGQLSVRNMRLGDGLFVLGGPDEGIEGVNVRFPTRPLGPDEWNDLIQDEICIEGHPSQRLRIHIDEEALEEEDYRS